MGPAVCLAIYKIYISENDFANLAYYINTEKASQILFSLLLSVLDELACPLLIKNKLRE